MQIEVAYALEKEQTLLSLNVAEPCTIAEAIEQSGILKEYKDINISQSKVGIFGKLATMDKLLREHDRIEIYRALIADPKQVRKKRAAEGKIMRSDTTLKNKK